MVDVQFNLMLADLAGAKRRSFAIEGPMHLKDFAVLAGIPEKSIGMVLINKAWTPVDCHIHDGDYVQLYPLLEGG